MVEFTCITIPSFKIKCVPAAAETVLISMGKVQLYKTCVFPKLSENIVNEHNFLFLVRNMNTFDRSKNRLFEKKHINAFKCTLITHI